jgi:hypothetical protein
MILKQQLLLIILLLCTCLCSAYVTPKHNSIVYSTTVYLEENTLQTAHHYSLALYSDALCTILIDSKSATHNTIPVFYANALKWGTTYYWQVKAFNKQKQCIATSPTHCFAIGKMEHATFGQIKINVNSKQEGDYATQFICLDQARSIFDNNGNLVWKIPLITGIVDSTCRIRDVKLTNNNTLTFLTDKHACEIDFEGNVLWKAPQPFVLNGNTIEYHHEFVKDKLGNYYVLGRYRTYRKILDKISDEVLNNQANILRTDTGVYNQTEIGIILKFNKLGKLLWYWDSNNYLKNIDLNYKKTANNFPNFSSHANAFSINDEGTYAYFGMRDFSRIVKIDMATKQAVAAYGEQYPSADVTYPNLFKFQHNAYITKDNHLLVFNNNDVNNGKTSRVQIINDNTKKGHNPLLWEFDIKFDTLTEGKAPSAGNVVELTNKNLLVCTGTLNRVFEVTPSKKIVWDAFVVCKKTTDTLWQPFINYRTCAINTIVQKHVFVSNLSYTSATKKIKFKLHNTGNVTDAYTIEIIDKNNTALHTSATNSIKPRQSKHATLLLTQATTNVLQLKITSNTNSFVSVTKVFYIE